MTPFISGYQDHKLGGAKVARRARLGVLISGGGVRVIAAGVAPVATIGAIVRFDAGTTPGIVVDGGLVACRLQLYPRADDYRKAQMNGGGYKLYYHPAKYGNSGARWSSVRTRNIPDLAGLSSAAWINSIAQRS